MIHIITPCTRPRNLKKIFESIPAPCRWIVVLDASVKGEESDLQIASFLDAAISPSTSQDFGRPGLLVKRSQLGGRWGNLCRNQALDELVADDDDWVYFLDDDNIIHPDWYWGVLPHLNSDVVMVGWGQLNKDESIRLVPPRNVLINHIDTASFMVRWKALKNFRWNTERRDADGLLAVEVDQQYGHETIDQYLCWHNALDQNDEHS